MNQPRIVTWRAVSSEEQAEKESLDYQYELNEEHVARCNGIVVDRLEVPGMSRRIILWEDACRKLPAFARLDELIKARAFDILMCQDVTRLGRRRSLIMAMAALCEEANIRIYEASSPPRDLDGSGVSSDDQLLLMFKGHQSEQEGHKFIERSLFGRQAQVRKGKHPGQQPTGYKRAYDSNGDSVTIIDEERAHLVTTFYDLYVEQGRSLRAIAREFNARGYPRPMAETSEWNQNAVGRFLCNRWTYAGFATWGASSKHPEKSFRVKAEWPALISEDVVRRAEEEMKRRSPAPRAVGAPQLFSLVCRCDMCKGNINVKSIGGKHSKYTCYICASECHGSFVRDPILIAAVRESILILQNDVVLEQMVGERPEDNNNLAEQIQTAKALREDVQKERNKLTRAYMRDMLDIEEYDALMGELKERQSKLARTITELENELALVPTQTQRRDRLIEIRDNGLAMLDHIDVPTANAWIRSHFVIFVRDNKVERIHLY